MEVVACSTKHLVLLNAKMWTKHLQSIPAEQEVVLSCRQRRTTQHVPQISKSLPVSEQYLNIRALVFEKCESHDLGEREREREFDA